MLEADTSCRSSLITHTVSMESVGGGQYRVCGGSIYTIGGLGYTHYRGVNTLCGGSLTDHTVLHEQQFWCPEIFC